MLAYAMFFVAVGLWYLHSVPLGRIIVNIKAGFLFA